MFSEESLPGLLGEVWQEEAFFVIEMVGDLGDPCVEECGEGLLLCDAVFLCCFDEALGADEGREMVAAEGDQCLVAFDWRVVEISHGYSSRLDWALEDRGGGGYSGVRQYGYICPYIGNFQPVSAFSCWATSVRARWRMKGVEILQSERPRGVGWNGCW